jgi:hypothetical protein
VALTCAMLNSSSESFLFKPSTMSPTTDSSSTATFLSSKHSNLVPVVGWLFLVVVECWLLPPLVLVVLVLVVPRMILSWPTYLLSKREA